MILLYVDDILIASNNNRLSDHVINILNEKYRVKDLGELRNYLGMGIQHLINTSLPIFEIN